MKFGQSLSEGSIPEWKDQYVNYKEGKKQIKKVAFLHAQLVEDKTSDVTPLLESSANQHGSVPEISIGTSIFAHEASDQASSRRKASIFNLSMKSARNKKEEFLILRSTFLQWLSGQLDKVDHFFMAKERDVYERFLVLEDQFFQLKDHRGRRGGQSASLAPNTETADLSMSRWTRSVKKSLQKLDKYEFPTLPSAKFMQTWHARGLRDSLSLKSVDGSEESVFDPNLQENQIRNGQLRVPFDTADSDLIDSDSQESDNVRSYDQEPPTIAQAHKSRQRDYVQKKNFGVPYYYAKKQLKKALVEHYRAVSLANAYKDLNRTAFRKITKKYDKALNGHISENFMKKVDNNSYFQTSKVLDTISSRIEDLYLDNFGNESFDRKHSLEKLRSATYHNAETRPPLYYKSVFLTGTLLGVGLPLFVLALYYALQKTLSGILPEGKYLLQIWGGFFLVNLAFLFMGINFLVFEKFKINYKFIFEFNIATALDYKQFFVIPSVGFALLGLFAWFSFQNFWPNSFPGRDWPIIYLGVMLIIFFNPTTKMFGVSRQWLQIAMWRILCSGFYPVEFRDFFLGDIFCSLTYSLGNLGFFFCLYGKEWKHFLGGGIPPSAARCGSSHSRAMGFLSALPSIWRFMQCVRRYMDSGDAFPHLANMLKYAISAIYYCLLSIWRIDRKPSGKAAFIVFACVNSVFSSIWDIVMDWSLGQVQSKHFLLRDELFYKKPVYYYAAMVADVILRFQWIFYVFFSNQLQQLAATSFCVALAELLRRFIWVFFRMENEHCTNVTLFRASRDSPLPYRIPLKVERAIKNLVAAKYDTTPSELSSGVRPEGRTSAYSAEPVVLINRRNGKHDKPPGQKVLRRKSTLRNLSNLLNKAHIKDFQRKKYNVQAEDSDEEEEEEDGEE